MALTLDQLVDRLISQGCREAIALDGGGSVCVLDSTGKVLLGYTVRQVCCALVFRQLSEGSSSGDIIAIPDTGAILIPQTGIIDYSQHIATNFTWGEFACKGETCGCNHSIMVGPPLYALVPKLQAMRTIARKPMHITSGTRCAKHDRAVGTSSSPGFGPHTTGGAVDEWIEGLSVEENANLAKRVGITGIGKYPNLGFVHLDMLGRSFVDER